MAEARIDPLIAAALTRSPSTARSIRVELPAPGRGAVAVPDLSAMETRLGDATRAGTFTKLVDCLDGVLVYDVPCSIESLGRLVVLEDIWENSGAAMRAMLTQVPQFPLGSPEAITAAADWCLAACRAISLRLQASGLDPRFMVKPGSPWITQSKPADVRSTERVRCELPSSWSEYCWKGERKPDVKMLAAGDSVMWTLAFRAGPAQRALAESAGSTPYWATQVGARAKLSYVLPSADWWNASHEWQDYFTQNPLDLVWPCWHVRPIRSESQALVDRELYPKSMLEHYGRDSLVGQAPSDRLRRLFEHYGANPAGHFEVSNNERIFVPTSKGQVAFCEAMLRDFLALEQRTLADFIFDAFSYYMLNHITWYAEAGLLGVNAAEIQNMVVASRRAKQAAAARGIGTAASAIGSAVFGPAAGQVIGRVASGFSRAVFGFIGKLIGAGGPGCPQTLFRRNIGSPIVGAESCTVQQTIERFRPPMPDVPQAADSAPLHWGWKVAGGAAVGIGAIMLIRRLLS